jgi:cell division septation protein DedD
MKVYLQVAALLLLGAAAAAVQAAGVLSVDSLSGQASVDRLGNRLQLKPGDLLSERDVIHVGEGGNLSLDFSGHGFIELGSGAELGVEKLPFASYADDLKSIFSLTRGYLRVVWKLPPQAVDWPLYIYFGAQHAALIPGEYFFDSRPGAARACVVAGHLSVLPNAGTQLQKLHPSACYRFVAGLPPERAVRDPSAWIAVRHGYNIDAPTSPEAMLAASDSGDDEPAAPAPPAAPPPARALPRPTILSMSPSTPAGDARPAAAAVAPPAAAPAAAPTGGEWIVNIASYPAAEVAQKHAQQLQAAGYGATVQRAEVKGQGWFRVQIRGYASAEAARAAAAELQARFAYQGLWVAKAGAAP